MPTEPCVIIARLHKCKSRLFRSKSAQISCSVESLFLVFDVIQMPRRLFLLFSNSCSTISHESKVLKIQGQLVQLYILMFFMIRVFKQPSFSISNKHMPIHFLFCACGGWGENTRNKRLPLAVIPGGLSRERIISDKRTIWFEYDEKN